ncbi:NHL repeat-containing protein [Parenemella sanctibonifatiensis]|uniref:Uncharacterized protein n=1 Tax=Parenemella sanctibonifatiensis TaxID=2016505 RepID=A0A255EF47_9ACTN|nr:hypothetical protein [Parenemella sanctibonifatiensis]OYN90169.1 hypothetical protein CGZ91_08315 [Parenemella sanctibonifatiensis]
MDNDRPTPAQPSPVQPFNLSRRGLLAAGALTGVGLVGLPGLTSRAYAAEADLGLTAHVADRGVVATERNVRSGAIGPSLRRTPLLYLLSDGNPVSFNVLDTETGELVGSFPLPPKSVGGYPSVADDGRVYLTVRDGKSTLVYRYDPKLNDVEFLVESPTGDAVTRNLRVDGDMMYGCTYPRAKAFAYNLVTGETRDYGKVAEGTDTYAWGFEKVGGNLYVGTGIGQGHAVKIDIETGEKTELPLPQEYDERLTYFYWFRRIGSLVAMAFSPGLEGGTNVLFWDTEAEDWVHDGGIPTFLSLNGPITQATPDGRVWYKSEGEIHEFNSATGKVTATGWIDTGLEETGSHRTLEMMMVGRGRTARPMLYGGNNDGSFWSFDPASGEHEFFDTVVEGAPLTTNSLGVGPDGRVYVPTYLGPGVTTRFDPVAGTSEQLSSPGQVDTVFTVGSQLLLGSYPGALVHSGDPAQEWDFGTNPALDFNLKAEAQDRIVAADGDGTRYAMGTVADYGVTGGALTIVEADGSRQVYRDLIDRHSVVAVLWGPDGLVYAGSSIRGGLSSPNGSGDAELLVFDPDAGSLVHHVVPVAKNDTICELALGADGQVWGITKSGSFFAFDIESRTVTTTIAHGMGGTGSPWGSGCTLVSHPSDGLLYGLADNKLFALDPATESWQVLDDGHALKRLSVAATGKLYTVDETHLYEVTISQS